MEAFVTTDTENPGLTRLRARIAERWDSLSRAERAVCATLTGSSSEHLLYASAADLGTESRTSNATVIRTLQSLGYAGLSELKQEVAAPFTTAVAPEVRLKQRIEYLGQNLATIQQEVWKEAESLLSLAAQGNTDADYSAAIDVLIHARTVYCYGLGASGIAAEHLALRLRRTGVSTRRLTVDGFRLADELLGLGAHDAIAVFAPGRVTRDIEAILDRANQVGAKTLLVTDELRQALADRVTATLAAPHTPTGITAEGLIGILIADVLVQGIVAVGPDKALVASQELNELRAQLGY